MKKKHDDLANLIKNIDGEGSDVVMVDDELCRMIQKRLLLVLDDIIAGSTGR